MKKVLYFLDNLEKYVLFVLFTVLVGLMFTQVVARYAFATAWGWMETLTRLLFVYLTYIGTSWAAKSASHLRVSAAAELIPGKYTKTIFFLIGDILLFIICAFFGWQLFKMASIFKANGNVYPGAKWLHVWVMYFAGVLGFWGTCIRIVQGGIIPGIKDLKAIKNGLPPHGVTVVDE